ncbi:putative lipoprotein [Actinacidiphila reveromycinica]|uniref:Putative lipoprotein n=1 Tax=Actinacidiphila reveromycinica TaxID=659352 RepID=A0A7U3UW96_9ACTN|nr:hypothetical protein [Streptomyces sp. SN-593]BBA99940.1 putative lipoprotein [Streptomyces sp. SN-593]
MAATRTFCAAVLGTAVAVAALTGCGGGGPDSDGPLVVPAATTAETGAFAGESADQVLSRAGAAMDAATSVTVAIRVADDEDGDVRVAAALTATGKCAASIENGGEDPVQVVGMHGTYYLKGDASYWQDQGGDEGDVLADAFAGKWVKLPSGEEDAVGDLDGFCTMDTLVAAVVDGDTVTDKEAVTTRYGTSVVPLRERDEDGTANVMYVAADGAPYIVALVSDDGEASIHFSDFDKPLEISAPPAGDTVDLGSVGGDAPHLSV